jgi:hypothetical protein
VHRDRAEQGDGRGQSRQSDVFLTHRGAPSMKGPCGDTTQEYQRQFIQLLF